ncbi:MAG: hypothetical protein E6G39_08020 [Actinobacteria bacterium]|nr:MAG: hypothetical protein E6G39_08020 [Actinomycetota bacterium]
MARVPPPVLRSIRTRPRRQQRRGRLSRSGVAHVVCGERVGEAVVLDIIVRGGRVIDGSGLPAFRADVGVHDGRIARIGRVDDEATRVVDATGRVVAPGFIDIHTHFDAQLSWDAYATPMIEHGVTTVVTGNCSLSLAPLHSHQRARMSRMFGQIEQLPQVLFDVGVEWSWETFAEWIAIRQRRLGVNLASSWATMHMSAPRTRARSRRCSENSPTRWRPAPSG